MNHITLDNGIAIPQVGLGTYLLEPDDTQSTAICVFDNDYTLADTANICVSEHAVGRGMRGFSKGREKILLETKLWLSSFERASAVDETLERLGMDYIDLMILHQPAGDTVAGYRILEKAHKEGKIHTIDLSNFDVAQTQRVLDECEVVPTINRIGCHPYLPQTEFKVLLTEYNIVLQARCPLGRRDNDSIMTEPLVQGLAEKYGKPPARVPLRWHIQQGYIVILRLRTPSHITQNISLFDFVLTDEDMAQIDSLDKGKPFFEHNDEIPSDFLAYVPDVEGQK